MPGDRFFDTNILFYAFTTGDQRSATAETLLGEGEVVGAPETALGLVPD